MWGSCWVTVKFKFLFKRGRVCGALSGVTFTISSGCLSAFVCRFTMTGKMTADWRFVRCFFLKKLFYPLCLGCSHSFFTFPNGCVILVDMVLDKQVTLTYGLLSTSLSKFCRWFVVWCLDFWGFISHPPNTTNVMSTTAKTTKQTAR